jgi:hypothetical protein
VGWDEVPRYCGHFWPIVKASNDRWGWLWSNWWPDPGSNQGRRGGKPATNRLSNGAAYIFIYSCVITMLSVAKNT